MIRVRELTADDWPLVEALFGERGACGGCWCMAWRLRSKDFEARKGARNKAALRRLVREGRAFGCLAFDGEEAVGWCSVGPRADFVRLTSMRSLKTGAGEGVWAVTCFFVPRAQRGTGVASALLGGAIRLARGRGAAALEGYPAVPYEAMGRRLPSAFAWTGVPHMFERAGFTRVPAPAARPVYRLTFGRRKRSAEPAVKPRRRRR